ncbi:MULTISPECIES: hypothetical protein [Bacillus]|uniref:Uncharacterized protein n=2 Tax=Bacillus TaxID=1386 RepID=A0A0M4FVM1_9BACI|nr:MULTISPECIES: hypothetical protein [Bacillus]ALC80788.1 hypothetical protein AM592_03675 [Bacillus gobiensis]MBP1079698.1 cation transport ATPase [Bacillus capparidis]MED1095099.1 hypothetical protein [Bacillus capparidis]
MCQTIMAIERNRRRIAFHSLTLEDYSTHPIAKEIVEYSLENSDDWCELFTIEMLLPDASVNLF